MELYECSGCHTNQHLQDTTNSSSLAVNSNTTTDWLQSLSSLAVNSNTTIDWLQSLVSRSIQAQDMWLQPSCPRSDVGARGQQRQDRRAEPGARWWCPDKSWFRDQRPPKAPQPGGYGYPVTRRQCSGGRTQIIPKNVIRQDPEPVPSTAHPPNYSLRSV
jgi:hypothetical protein